MTTSPPLKPQEAFRPGTRVIAASWDDGDIHESSGTVIDVSPHGAWVCFDDPDRYGRSVRPCEWRLVAFDTDAQVPAPSESEVVA